MRGESREKKSLQGREKKLFQILRLERAGVLAEAGGGERCWLCEQGGVLQGEGERGRA